MGHTLREPSTKKSCPKQYRVRMGDPLYKKYVQIAYGRDSSKGDIITSAGWTCCRDNEKICCHVGSEKECPKYPHDSSDHEPKKSGFGHYLSSLFSRH